MWSGWAQASKVKQYLFTCFLSNCSFFLFLHGNYWHFCQIQSCIWFIHVFVVDYFIVLLLSVAFECGAQPLWGRQVCVWRVECSSVRVGLHFLTGDGGYIDYTSAAPAHYSKTLVWSEDMRKIILIQSRNQFLWSNSPFCPSQDLPGGMGSSYTQIYRVWIPTGHQEWEFAHV